jgi:polyferredoxin
VDVAVETWQDILRPQAVDLTLLITYVAFALVSFFRKSRRMKYATLVFSVAYLGFYKSHLVSVVDLFGAIDGNLPIPKYNISYYALAAFVFLSTLLWGRLYCGRVCAFGALTQLMDAVFPKRMRVDLPAAFERRAAWIKYAVLGGVIFYFVATRDILVYRYVEPFWMFGLFGSAGMWVGLGLLLAATVFVRNLYCRFLCPVGALLGIMSGLTVFRIKRWSECRTCRICEKTCEWGAIRGPEIVKRECVRCDDCERLYLDRQKCPHWLILFKARPSGVQQSAGGRPVPASSPLRSPP